MRIDPPKPPRRGSISVSLEAFERIRVAAKQQGMSIGAFVEDRVNQYLNRKGQP